MKQIPDLTMMDKELHPSPVNGAASTACKAMFTYCGSRNSEVHAVSKFLNEEIVFNL
jgi:hypothetical protein